MFQDADLTKSSDFSGPETNESLELGLFPETPLDLIAIAQKISIRRKEDQNTSHNITQNIPTHFLPRINQDQYTASYEPDDDKHVQEVKADCSDFDGNSGDIQCLTMESQNQHCNRLLSQPVPQHHEFSSCQDLKGKAKASVVTMDQSVNPTTLNLKHGAVLETIPKQQPSTQNGLINRLKFEDNPSESRQVSTRTLVEEEIQGLPDPAQQLWLDRTYQYFHPQASTSSLNRDQFILPPQHLAREISKSQPELLQPHPVSTQRRHATLSRPQSADIQGLQNSALDSQAARLPFQKSGKRAPSASQRAQRPTTGRPVRRSLAHVGSSQTVHNRSVTQLHFSPSVAPTFSSNSTSNFSPSATNSLRSPSMYSQSVDELSSHSLQQGDHRQQLHGYGPPLRRLRLVGSASSAFSPPPKSSRLRVPQRSHKPEFDNRPTTESILRSRTGLKMRSTTAASSHLPISNDLVKLYPATHCGPFQFHHNPLCSAPPEDEGVGGGQTGLRAFDHRLLVTWKKIQAEQWMKHENAMKLRERRYQQAMKGSNISARRRISGERAASAPVSGSAARQGGRPATAGELMTQSPSSRPNVRTRAAAPSSRVTAQRAATARRSARPVTSGRSQSIENMSNPRSRRPTYVGPFAKRELKESMPTSRSVSRPVSATDEAPQRFQRAWNGEIVGRVKETCERLKQLIGEPPDDLEVAETTDASHGRKSGSPIMPTKQASQQTVITDSESRARSNAPKNRPKAANLLKPDKQAEEHSPNPKLDLKGMKDIDPDQLDMAIGEIVDDILTEELRL